MGAEDEAPPTSAVDGVFMSRVFTVEFREPGVLGMFFSPESKRALTVERLAASGLALREPAIQPGCALVAVQGESLAGLSYEACLGRIRSAGRPLRLTFENPLCPACGSPWQWCVCSYLANENPEPEDGGASTAHSSEGSTAGESGTDSAEESGSDTGSGYPRSVAVGNGGLAPAGGHRAARFEVRGGIRKRERARGSHGDRAAHSAAQEGEGKHAKAAKEKGMAALSSLASGTAVSVVTYGLYISSHTTRQLTADDDDNADESEPPAPTDDVSGPAAFAYAIWAWLESLAEAIDGGIGVVHQPAVLGPFEQFVFLSLLLLVVLDLILDLPKRFPEAERVTAILIRQSAVRLYFTFRACRGLHERVGPWGWALILAADMLLNLVGIGTSAVFAKAKDASKPPLLGVLLMLFVCWDCWPDDAQMPALILGTRAAWAVLRRVRGGEIDAGGGDGSGGDSVRINDDDSDINDAEEGAGEMIQLVSVDDHAKGVTTAGISIAPPLQQQGQAGQLPGGAGVTGKETGGVGAEEGRRKLDEL